MSKKLKAVESNVQPNHKEAELWITPTNNDGSKEVKYWNSKAQQWSKCEGEGNGESGGSNIDNWVYYDISSIPSKVGLIEYALLPALVKIKTDNEVAICGFSSCFANVPTENIESKLNAIHSIAFPLNCKVIGSSIFENGVILTEEFLDNTMMLQPFKTTKEEFYSLT